MLPQNGAQSPSLLPAPAIVPVHLHALPRPLFYSVFTRTFKIQFRGLQLHFSLISVKVLDLLNLIKKDNELPFFLLLLLKVVKLLQEGNAS